MFSFLKGCNCDCWSPAFYAVIYLLSFFFKVSTVHYSSSSLFSSNFDTTVCGSLDFIIDKSCLWSMFPSSDCNTQSYFSVTSKYVLSDGFLFNAIANIIHLAC